MPQIAKNLLPALLLLLATPLFSQTKKDENVVISSSKREFRFVKGDAANPVKVKEKSTRTYFCKSYRTDISFVEFYNDLESIDDVDIVVDGSKKTGITPKYEYYSSEGIFFSDAKVCYFQLPMARQGSSSKVTIEKTYNDPQYFTRILFSDTEPINEQEITITIPTWMNVDLKEFNFGKLPIKQTVDKGTDENVYTYRMTNLKALPRESSSPGITYYAPHVLVMSKFADTKDGRITFFNTLADQYKWYHKLVLETGNDPELIRVKTEEIIKGITSEEQKVKTIFQWVQDNIRYIAFEDGIAGFKPQKAQVVLAKKYGDCKGMANLMTEMLRSVKIDARRCWIGTRHLAYDYTTPSLAVDNHMISVWVNKDKYIFLDGTEKYIGMGEVAERIQGRPVLIENGDKYIVGKVPVANHLQNTSFEKRILSIDGSTIKGRVQQNWKGENKEWVLSGLHSIKQDKQETALKNYLSEGKTNFAISDLKVLNMDDYNKDINVEYNITWKDALTEFGDDTYIELDNRRNLENFRIDTSTRTLPYWFYFKNHLVFETELALPAGKKVGELPAALSIKQPGYHFKGDYSAKGSSLLYRCEIVLNDSELKPAEFSQWNRDIEQLRNFYNQQIVITKAK